MVAIIGSGPAALMAAEVVSAAGIPVSLYEKRKGLGRKLLIAGSSGLNITNGLDLPEFISHYIGGPAGFWEKTIGQFPPQAWLRFIEDSLGIGTFKGTSNRYFVENMKASLLLKKWTDRLRKQGVTFYFAKEWIDFDLASPRLRFSDGSETSCDAVCFCLGGGSYEPQEKPLRWPGTFAKKGFTLAPFEPSNVGYQVAWSEDFLKEAEGLPLKGIEIRSAKGAKKGDAMITRYGIEGTPVYFVGTPGTVTLDLKPDLSAAQIEKKLREVKENWSVIRRIKKQLALGPAALALVFHYLPPEMAQEKDLLKVSRFLKAFPLRLITAQSLDESISSSGGLCFSELDPELMLKKAPGYFAAGEMLDWDVPTGGFLIQGCVSLGHAAGSAIVRRLKP